MKFRITMKDPDGASDGLNDAAYKELPAGLSDLEKDTVAELRVDTIGDFVSKWMQYKEYLTVEFDTELGTATVVPVED